MNEKEKKVIVLGASNSGKTSILRQICNKTLETVAMEYGNTIFEGIKIHFFSAPSSERFAFMHQVLSKNIDGTIILMDENGLTPTELNTAVSIKKEGLPFIIITAQHEQQEHRRKEFKDIPTIYTDQMDHEAIYKGIKVLLNIIEPLKELEKIKITYEA